MCSAIITRNIFIVNALHTVLQDLLLPPWVNQNCQFLQLVLQIFMHKIYMNTKKIYMNTKKIYMNTNKFWMNMHEFAWKRMHFTWTRINFAWTWVNFAWTRMKVDQNFRVCSRYLGHVTSVWNRHPNFCGSIWRPYYSTQNMWSSFTSIIITYTVASTFMPQPLLWKSTIFAMNKYICLWWKKG